MGVVTIDSNSNIYIYIYIYIIKKMLHLQHFYNK